MLKSADGINHLEAVNIVENRIDGEVTAQSVFQYKLFPGHARLALERGDFHDFCAKICVDDGEAFANDLAVAEQGANAFVVGIGRHVEIARDLAAIQDSESAANQESQVSFGFESIEYFQDTLWHLFSCDWMFCSAENAIICQ